MQGVGKAADGWTLECSEKAKAGTGSSVETSLRHHPDENFIIGWIKCFAVALRDCVTRMQSRLQK
jgi:hypothetical protein